jgi:hypothetical protein
VIEVVLDLQYELVGSHRVLRIIERAVESSLFRKSYASTGTSRLVHGA